mgnify:CR=1 FL=1
MLFRSDGLMGKAVSQVRQFICGLHGHDALLHVESGRMSLRCTSCDYETDGWDLSPVPRDVEAPSTEGLPLPLFTQRRAA